MTDNEGLNPRNLTFSQAQGYEEIPCPLALEVLNQEARIKLWDLLSDSAWSSYDGFLLNRQLHGQWHAIFQALHRDFFIQPMDEFPDSTGSLIQLYRTGILDELPFNKVFDLFQMVMRHPYCPTSFTTNVAGIFERCQLAYVVDTEHPATILPAATRQEGKALINALTEFREAGLQGTETHLRQAAELINRGDWPGAVRESIHAVESVARQLDPGASTLGPALTSLEKHGHLHPALKEAFSKLYGYTSDEKGIRHSLLATAKSPAGQDEALFMLGACASFASYLWRRHRTGS